MATKDTRYSAVVVRHACNETRQRRRDEARAEQTRHHRHRDDALHRRNQEAKRRRIEEAEYRQRFSDHRESVFGSPFSTVSNSTLPSDSRGSAIFALSIETRENPGVSVSGNQPAGCDSSGKPGERVKKAEEERFLSQVKHQSLPWAIELRQQPPNRALNRALTHAKTAGHDLDTLAGLVASVDPIADANHPIGLLAYRVRAAFESQLSNGKPSRTIECPECNGEQWLETDAGLTGCDRCQRRGWIAEALAPADDLADWESYLDEMAIS